MRNVYRLLKVLPALSDNSSRIAFLKLARSCFWRSTPDSALVSLRLKSLGGRSVFCRPNTRDASVLMYVFGEAYHFPPCGLSPIRRILDLGSNIGLTLASYAARYPAARIVGVELDAANAALCRRNVESWSPAVEVIRGAVWVRDGEVRYSGDGEDAFRLTTEDAGSVLPTAPALTMSTLLGRFGAEPVDFLKMDIEGAEEQVLESAEEWIHRVRCISVEVHPPFTVGRCLTALEQFGFRCVADYRNPPSVVGVRAT